jgi:hypothetical protein
MRVPRYAMFWVVSVCSLRSFWTTRRTWSWMSWSSLASSAFLAAKSGVTRLLLLGDYDRAPAAPPPSARGGPAPPRPG